MTSATNREAIGEARHGSWDEVEALRLGMRGTPCVNERIFCPHCWKESLPEDLLYLARHSALLGDDVAGPDEPKRFRPLRFTPEGHALDARGTPCHELACPKCHLLLPRAMIDTRPLVVSIVGSPQSESPTSWPP